MRVSIPSEKETDDTQRQSTHIITVRLAGNKSEYLRERERSLSHARSAGENSMQARNKNGFLLLKVGGKFLTMLQKEHKLCSRYFIAIMQ